MKNLKLPEHFDIGDIVITVNPNENDIVANNWLNRWLPGNENQLGVIMSTNWGTECMQVWHFNGTGTSTAQFYLFKLIKKNTPEIKRFLKVICGIVCP